MLKSLKSKLFGSENNKSQPQVSIDGWMLKASRNSDWSEGITSGAHPMHGYYRACETAPDYEKPILKDEVKNCLMYDLVSSVRNTFQREYEVNDDISIVTESNNPDENGLVIKVKINDNFEKWASHSRLRGEDGFQGDFLGLAGQYYVDLLSEIRDAINQKHLNFECVKEREEYSVECFCSNNKLNNILN